MFNNAFAPINPSFSLKSVKNAFDDGSISEHYALSCYQRWVNTPSYIVLTEADHDRPVRELTSGSWPSVRPTRYWVNYFFVKASKRGNDVYRLKVSRRFSPLFEKCKVLKNVDFIDSGKDRYVDSHLLFFTLTYNPKICSKSNAWLNVGSELNLFFSNLKKRYGRIKCIRCFEAFRKNGYPHIHLIVEFLDHDFRLSRYRFKKGKRSGNVGYIIASKDEELYINSLWHSFASCEGVKNAGAVGYILKYITKEMYISDNYNTVSHLWLYHKQSYSVSKDFLDYSVSFFGCSVPQLDTNMYNSNLKDRELHYLCSFNSPYFIKESFFIVRDPPDTKIWENGDFEVIIKSNFDFFYENKLDANEMEVFFDNGRKK